MMGSILGVPPYIFDMLSIMRPTPIGLQQVSAGSNRELEDLKNQMRYL
jgi:hypothetical protein